MIRKSLVVFALFAISASFALAQQPTTPEKKRATEAAVFAYTFGGDSFLGVYTENVNKDNFAKFGLREVRGVAITKVEENSPAAKAGLMVNDVIVRIDGDEVTSVRKLNRLISEIAPDHSATITILRNGQQMDVRAVLEKREMKMFNGTFTVPNVEMPNIQIPRVEMPKVVPQVWTVPPGGVLSTDGTAMFFGMNRQIGVSVSSLGKQLGDYFGVEDGKGLLVTNVRADSPAFKAGIKAGDVIVQVDGKPVATSMDLIRSIGTKKEGDVRLTIIRDKNRQEISVTPEQMKGEFTPFVEGTLPKVPKVPVVPKVPAPVI
ncbi:MAG TPA: PDZ domain-containing protein [Pyrinomonadaceae bacterium]|nr:PDZ domain-containing protein [Pyrinomonadaceae bacterium]HNU07548.1 PDZ domain-containing protein [Pyrinomonadaceae bacterium]